MDKRTSECKEYVDKILSRRTELRGYIKNSTILLNTYEDNKVWDLMILINNEWFKYEFAYLYGEHFVVDDHEHEPPVFTRIKSYNWLEENFSKRISVALWIFQNAAVIQAKDDLFFRIIAEQKEKFTKNLRKIIRRKYLEMREARHNLRYSAERVSDIANIILKANIAKICFELGLLADGKPYPFGILLPHYTKSHAAIGQTLFHLAQDFLAEVDPKKTIALSNQMIEVVSSALKATEQFSDDFLSKWWLYLD